MKNCTKNENTIQINLPLITVEFSQTEKTYNSLQECARYFFKLNDVKNTFSEKIFFVDEEILDKKSYKIINELAKAIDENSVSDVRELKNKYSSEKEYKTAIEFLDEKCKLVWNINNSKLAPKQAMKVLGITNIPSLKSLLETTLNLCESNEKSMATSKVIERIIKNKDLGYSIEDIHKYLKNEVITKNLKLNDDTILYLIKKHNYSMSKLLDLGINKKRVERLISVKSKLKQILFKIKQELTFSIFFGVEHPVLERLHKMLRLNIF